MKTIYKRGQFPFLLIALMLSSCTTNNNVFLNQNISIIIYGEDYSIGGTTNNLGLLEVLLTEALSSEERDFLRKTVIELQKNNLDLPWISFRNALIRSFEEESAFRLNHIQLNLGRDDSPALSFGPNEITVLLKTQFYLSENNEHIRVAVFASAYRNATPGEFIYSNRLFAERKCFLNFFHTKENTEITNKTTFLKYIEALNMVAQEASEMLCYDMTSISNTIPEAVIKTIDQGDIIRQEDDIVWIRGKRSDLISSDSL